ncbi:MAG: hypothetical protein KUG58_03675 [Marinosulfonomonas sp.]|nr:hypothetical protein [Marinosulfonomonas sp.]
MSHNNKIPPGKRQPQGKPARRGRVGFWMLASIVFLFGLMVYAGMSVTGTPMTAPNWMTQQIVARINNGLPSGRMTIARLQLQVSQAGMPGIQVRDIGVYDDAGTEVARLNEVGVRLSLPDLLKGQIRAREVRLAGAQMTIRRRQDGQFALSFGGSGNTSGTFADVLDSFDDAFKRAPLNRVGKLLADDLTIALEDARSGRIWQITEGHLQLTRLEEGLDLAIDFEVFNGTEELAQLVVGIQTDAASSQAAFGVSFSNAAAADIALQSPVLSFLGVLDAPISGALRVDFDEAGGLDDFAGTLEIGTGVLQPTPATKPVAFTSGKAYFSYDPGDDKLTFSQVAVQTEAANLVAEGQAYLRDYEDGWPKTFLTQLRLSDLLVDPEDMFSHPVEFSQGAVEFRLKLDPFSVQFGQVILRKEPEVLSATGLITAGESGWEMAGDLSLSNFTHDQMLEFWPLSAVPKTRNWVVQNVSDAFYPMLRAAVRIKPDQPPLYSVGFQFRDASLRYIKKLPEIQNGTGFGTIEGQVFTLGLEDGFVQAPMGGRIDLSGSTMTIPDIRQKPARADLTLRGKAQATAALSLLAQPPFRVLKNSTLPPDMASGSTEFVANVSFPTTKKIALADITYRAQATLANMSSDVIVPGRLVQAEKLILTADPAKVEISGPAKIGRVWTDFLWAQQSAVDQAGKSSVSGSIELTQGFIDEFGIGLPQGSVSGVGRGEYTIDLAKDQRPRFVLNSDLQGIAISVPPIGWSKSTSSTGQLKVAGSLGKIPVVEDLELSAPGLSATGGSLTLNDDGTMGRTSFEALKVGAWLDAPVVLSGRGAGTSPGVTVSGGTIDIRETSFGGGGGGTSSGAGGPISLAMDRVIVSEGISLTEFVGDFSGSEGFVGDFKARVNGGARITGHLAPDKNGTAIRILSDNAGGVMRSAGVFENAAGGKLDMTLRPSKENGVYKGNLTATNTRVVDAPALTELLNAISIVGLLDQLSGPGISFVQVEASFVLSPTLLKLKRSSATGPSIGVAMDGIYDLTTSLMDMQGVVSPVYFLNAIGQAVSSRRGEGLFGFNFRLSGSADEPRVKVNPLSILTPGIFRDIFRR